MGLGRVGRKVSRRGRRRPVNDLRRAKGHPTAKIGAMGRLVTSVTKRFSSLLRHQWQCAALQPTPLELHDLLLRRHASRLVMDLGHQEIDRGLAQFVGIHR